MKTIDLAKEAQRRREEELKEDVIEILEEQLCQIKLAKDLKERAEKSYKEQTTKYAEMLLLEPEELVEKFG